MNGRGRKYRKPRISEEKRKKWKILYEQKGFSADDIARIFAETEQVVLRNLKAANTNLRWKKFTKETVDEWIDLFTNRHWTIYKIAKNYNTNHSVVKTNLLKRDVKMRQNIKSILK